MVKEHIKSRNREILSLYYHMRDDIVSKQGRSVNSFRREFKKTLFEKYYIKSRMQVYRILKDAQNGTT